MTTGPQTNNVGAMRAFVRHLVLVVAVLGILPATASANLPGPLSQWIGLPGLNAASGAQWVRAYAYASVPPTTVYAGLEGGGVYRSVNGGVTWSAFNTGFPNPATTNVRALLTSGLEVWAGTDSGLWKSTGGAWQPIAQGPEDDPANPKKLNQSVQSLISLPGGVMLAGVFSGGVYRSTDGGATWKPPAVNSGIPPSSTIFNLTSNVPGVVYATGGEGVFISLNAGASWTRFSDGIPGSATPIATWAYSPARPNILFASTASNGLYRSWNAGITWSEINDGLGAVRARGLQVITSSAGAHLYAGTENGLWEALQKGTVLPSAPKWHKVTDDGLITQGSTNTIMWALTRPEIPGLGGAPGLMAGTQSNGGYFLAFEPVDNACSVSNPVDAAPCPRITGTPNVGQQLVASVGTWTGTKLIDYDYQWQQCTTSNTSSCTDIPDAEESTYVVPDGATGLRYRVKVSATNPAPTIPATNYRYSVLKGPAIDANGYPGANQRWPANVVVLAPGDTSSPRVGDTVYAEDGTSPNQFNDGFFNPKADTRTFQWLRCDTGQTDCNEIPGATARSYKLTPADGNGYVAVRVRGKNANGYGETALDYSNFITSLEAAIGDPFPNPDGGAPLSQAPSINGTAYVGEMLVGSVGGWKDPTTSFLRRWLRCSPDGTSCQTITKPASVDVEDGSTYIVQPQDRGSVIRFRVIADVNGDLSDDGIDNHLPHATEYDTAPTSLVTDRPLPNTGGGAGGGGGGGTPQADATAPILAGLTLTKRSFVAGKGTVFRITVSEPGRVRVVITRATSGRKVKGACAPVTKKNRKAKRCTYQRVVHQFEQPVGGGAAAIPFSGKIGKRRLPVGTYTATLAAIDGAGNASPGVSIRFTIKRR